MSTLPTPPSHATPTPTSPSSPYQHKPKPSPPRIVIKSPTCSPPSPSESSLSSGSSTETEMSDRREKRDGSGGKSASSKSSSKSSSVKTGKKAQKDDWSGVNEPDERRRIQNRLAQRKFREKAKDQKESRDRDAENQLHAGYSYTSPDPDDLGFETELSGLPWGGPSMRHIVERGKATTGGSRQGSRDYSFY
ncbi:hypothetical protein V493_07673, partial [Pseudogymnoascus sp. VKM F-4281 (FW-2241)]